MGSRDPQKQLWSYHVNLDKRVRSDHPLRKLNEVLKLHFFREEVTKFYGMNGNVSEDPAVIIKMMLLLFLDNVRSERELMRIIPERLDYMWFLGYGLDDAIPNHSNLSKARKRWGQNVFVSLFSQVVAKRVIAGLVEASKIQSTAAWRRQCIAKLGPGVGRERTLQRKWGKRGALQSALDATVPESAFEKSRYTANLRTMSRIIAI